VRKLLALAALLLAVIMLASLAVAVLVVSVLAPVGQRHRVRRRHAESCNRGLAATLSTALRPLLAVWVSISTPCIRSGGCNRPRPLLAARRRARRCRR
jgi:hypothetical protein